MSLTRLIFTEEDQVDDVEDELPDDWPDLPDTDEREAALTAAERNGCVHPFARPRF
jgi:hypothetical protein